MPYTLTYSSVAAFAMDDIEVEALLARSRARNATDGITGLLVYIRVSFDHSAFVQVLEGPRDQVVRTFERIRRDELHHTITVVRRSEIDSARFGEWSMRFAMADRADLPADIAARDTVDLGRLELATTDTAGHGTEPATPPAHQPWWLSDQEMIDRVIDSVTTR